MSGEFDGLLAEIAAISLSRRYGRVTGIGRGTLSVGGLEQGTALGDRVEICGAGGILGGEVLRLSSHEVTILPDGSPEGLAIGDAVALVGPAEIAPDDSWIGRIVDPLGRPLDGLPAILPEARLEIERPAPGIVDRDMVAEPVETGLLVVDALFAVGRGQRELIIGERATGKTSLAVDAS